MIGGMVLHDGAIAEMKTGEGKTLTSTLPIVLNALAGRGVHLVTVNDYLARRDAEWMKPIYDMLGVTVGILQSGEYDSEVKRAAYAADVTYGTNSEFGFDYLRDNLAKTRRREGPAARPLLRDRRRGRQHPHRRGAHPADHLGPARAGRRPLLQVRAPGPAPRGRARSPRAIEAKSKDYEADFDFEPDEKHKTVAITERGVEKAEKFLGIENMYLAEHGNLVNHLIQALKAESLYKKDVDYAVIDGEVKIIDEFTGRILEGRRWSEGLHQAVEAKEGVAIQEENQTVATITYQNYFRKYEKLAGMTGTALTEATEFSKIYKLQVVDIPTNRPVARDDRNDQIYKTKEGKWAGGGRGDRRAQREGPAGPGRHDLGRGLRAARRAAQEEGHQARRPERQARARRARGRDRRRGRPARRGHDRHQHGGPRRRHQARRQRRAPDRARAAASSGSSRAPTSTTRCGTRSIPKIEAKVEEDRQKVMELGGLFILGTERHESRRIDNQLRGRSGRQGDPGESLFFLSAEDDLVRLFAGDRIYRILDRLGPGERGGPARRRSTRRCSRSRSRAPRRRSRTRTS